MNRLIACPLTALLLTGAAPVSAAEAAAEAAAQAAADSTADASDRGDIVVTGQRVQYGVKSTSTATKTNTDIKDIPQGLTTITAQQIEDQQLRSVADLLNFVPGASYGSGEGNRDQIVLRGNSSAADFFIDGVRDDVTYFRDFYNVDRVEVLKGPNAMIFGRGGGGGVINRVLKRPSFTAARVLSASGDWWGGARFAADADQPVSNNFAIRLNGVYEDSDSFRRFVNLKRYGINPTAALLLGPDTRVDLSYEYFRDRRTADRGIPALNSEPVRGFTRTFFGDPRNSFSEADVNLVTFAIEHRLGQGLTLRNRTMFGDYDKFYQNIYPNSRVLAATTLLPERVRLGAYNNRMDRRTLFNQTDLIWESRLAGIGQTLLFGVELGRERSRNRRLSGSFSSSAIIDGNAVPLADPTVALDLTFTPLPSDANNRSLATVAAAYVQDQIRISPRFEIVAGLRFDSFRLGVDDLRAVSGGRFSRRDGLWSPRLGLVMKPSDRLSFYASYSRSYLPQSGDQFSSLTSVTEGLKPERFDNYEVGAKWEIVNGLLATAAVYRLDRKNTRAIDPNNSTLTILSGGQRSRGLELGLERSLTSRWLVSGGYTLQKAEITSPIASGSTNIPVGREVPLVPRHSFSLWNRYDVTERFGAGLGVIARSKSYTSLNNVVRLPGYARVDGALYYRLPHGLQAQVNVENLLGTHYFPTSNGDNNIAPGAPRTVKATVGYRF